MVMKSLFFKDEGEKYVLCITFSSEEEERAFCTTIMRFFARTLNAHCALTDTDSTYYIPYFTSAKAYIGCIGNVSPTSVTIIAHDINNEELDCVISNWPYYTFEAIIAFGTVDNNQKDVKQMLGEIKTLPIIITQILDNTISVEIGKQYYNKSFWVE